MEGITQRLKKFSLILIFLFCGYNGGSQIPLKIKEEFDYYNRLRVLSAAYQPCSISPNSDHEIFGDHMANILEGYITMYQTTGDKAYLYKFILETLCMMENRHDYAQITSNACWSDFMYHNGNIAGAFARFVYLVKIEETSLQSISLYQFPEIASNFWSVNFPTFLSFANWLEDRASETVNQYINNGFWDSYLCWKDAPNKDWATVINKQSGFAKATLFLGQTKPDNNYTSHAMQVADRYLSSINVIDPCDDDFTGPVLTLETSDNTYWWYHYGWSIETYNCHNGWLDWFYDAPEYGRYTQYYEDISHGAVTSLLALTFYNYQLYTPFTDDDIVRFRNMFTKKIFDGSGGFYEAVNGTNGPVEPTYSLDISALSYAPFADYDGYDATATTPNAYDIIMDYYDIYMEGGSSLPSSEYGGMANKGHANLVKAQWERECTNLTLYNRDVVYDQDFFSNNNLNITPNDNSGNFHQNNSASYFYPTSFTDNKFIVRDGVTSNMTAAEEINFEDGFEAEIGSEVTAEIIPTACTDGSRMTHSGNTGAVSRTAQATGAATKNTRMATTAPTVAATAPQPKATKKAQAFAPVYNNGLKAVPNPFGQATTLQLTMAEAGWFSVSVYNAMGNEVYNKPRINTTAAGAYSMELPAGIFTTGVYECVVTLNGAEKLHTRLVKL